MKPNVLRQGGSQPFIFLEVKSMRFGTSGQSSEGGLSQEILEVFVLLGWMMFDCNPQDAVQVTLTHV